MDLHRAVADVSELIVAVQGGPSAELAPGRPRETPDTTSAVSPCRSGCGGPGGARRCPVRSGTSRWWCLSLCRYWNRPGEQVYDLLQRLADLADLGQEVVRASAVEDS